MVRFVTFEAFGAAVKQVKPLKSPNPDPALLVFKNFGHNVAADARIIGSIMLIMCNLAGCSVVKIKSAVPRPEPYPTLPVPENVVDIRCGKTVWVARNGQMVDECVGAGVEKIKSAHVISQTQHILRNPRY